MKGGDEAMPAPAASSQPLEWKFSQVFGERTAGEEVQEGIFSHWTVVEHPISVYLLDPIGILCISCNQGFYRLSDLLQIGSE